MARRSRTLARRYLLFEALGEEQGGLPWWRWPPQLRDRTLHTLAAATQRLEPAMRARARQQWRFDMQWRALREHAAARGVRIFGDLPIYVAPDSVTTWGQPPPVPARWQWHGARGVGRAAGLLRGRRPAVGNPLYDWDAQRRDGFRFWLQRLQLQADRFDLLRIDHFRALEAYWSVPAGSPTAREGTWRKAPGAALAEGRRGTTAETGTRGEDLGVIHARGQCPASRVPPARHSRAAVRLRRRSDQSASATPA